MSPEALKRGASVYAHDILAADLQYLRGYEKGAS